MKSIRRLHSFPLAAAAILGACATTKLDTARPITERGNLVVGRSFDQGGERLDLADMLKKLEADERTGDDVRRSEGLAIAGGLMQAGGALLGGVYLGLWEAGRSANWVGLGAGAGLMVASWPISYLSARSLSKAIDTYNAGVNSAGGLEDGSPEREAALAASNALRWTLQVGFDFGFKEVAWVTDGERRSLHLNDGFALRFGVAVPYGAWETELRAGIKLRELTWQGSAATESDIGWLTVPVEALQALNVGPIRLAAGLAIHHFRCCSSRGRLPPRPFTSRRPSAR